MIDIKKLVFSYCAPSVYVISYENIPLFIYKVTAQENDYGFAYEKVMNRITGLDTWRTYPTANHKFRYLYFFEEKPVYDKP